MSVSIQGNTKGGRRLCALTDFAIGAVILEEKARFFAKLGSESELGHMFSAPGERAVYELAKQAWLAIRSKSWSDYGRYADSRGESDFSEAKAASICPEMPRGPDAKVFAQLYRVVATNNLCTFVETPNGRQVTGHGFFDTLSFVNHTCYHANAAVVPAAEDTLQLVAQSYIKKGDEIKIAYTVFESGTPCHIRRSYLREMLGFDCTCPTCDAEQKSNADLIRKMMPNARLAVCSDDYQGPRCQCCGSIHDLKRCSRCKQAWYCSRACQIADWKDTLFGPEHRSVCKKAE